jgi:hypothetical protein
MPRVTERIRQAAGRRVEEVENAILVQEGKRSLRAKVENVKRVTRKAAKAGAIAGAVVATAVVMRERRKRRKLTH